jgi:hypothetical protein
MPTPFTTTISRKACSWHAFQVGLRDWLAERMLPASARPPKDRPVRFRALQGLLLLGLLLCAPFLAAALGPAAAGAMSMAGTEVVAGASIFLGIVLGAGVLVGLPAYAVFRVVRFGRAMCERGQAILDGTRVPVRSKA